MMLIMQESKLVKSPIEGSMSKEYIERQRAIVDACNSLELYPSEYATLEDALNRIPAADVVPAARSEQGGSR